MPVPQIFLDPDASLFRGTAPGAQHGRARPHGCAGSGVPPLAASPRGPPHGMRAGNIGSPGRTGYRGRTPAGIPAGHRRRIAASPRSWGWPETGRPPRLVRPILTSSPSVLAERSERSELAAPGAHFFQRTAPIPRPARKREFSRETGRPFRFLRFQMSADTWSWSIGPKPFKATSSWDTPSHRARWKSDLCSKRSQTRWDGSTPRG